MAKITKTVCDRCGREIEYKGWTGIIKRATKSKRSFKFTRLLCGNQSGYDYAEGRYELCTDCTSQLAKFLLNI